MTAALLPAAGGVGLFLLGMTLMTGALRDLAGPALRRYLAEATRTPATGALAGALATAVVQSSSAITLMAVGFAGAGLLTFPQALGVVFGANLGTTVTGWMVALIGFKLELGLAALPLVLLAALAAAFGGGRLREAGLALAGFSLIFIGIDFLQTGLGAFGDALTPGRFPPDTLLGRAQLVLLGAAITAVTQSSSAGVAAALAAIGAGAITFEQAAAMVIGMDFGTTLKSLVAGFGGSTAMRRTGLAHVVYNLMTAVFAFAILGPFADAARALTAGPGVGDPQIALVAFHSLFNGAGVVAVLPFAGAFARLIERLIPERGEGLAARLDDRLLAEPDSAADAALATARALRDALAAEIGGAVAPRPRRLDRALIDEADRAADAARAYAERIGARAGAAREARIAVLHALDHIERLIVRARQADRIAALREDRRLARLAGLLSAALAAPADAERLDRLRRLLRRWRERFRDRAVRAAADGRLDPETALAQMDAMRWLHRVAYHFWRIGVRLDAPQAGAGGTATKGAQPPPAGCGSEPVSPAPPPAPSPAAAIPPS